VTLGASSGSGQIRREPFYFTLIGLPHGTDPQRVAERGPHDDATPVIQFPGADVLPLAVVLPVIGYAEIAPSSLQSQLPLDAGEGRIFHRVSGMPKTARGHGADLLHKGLLSLDDN
jgi:hypothetical protein